MVLSQVTGNLIFDPVPPTYFRPPSDRDAFEEIFYIVYFFKISLSLQLFLPVDWVSGWYE